MYFINFYEFCLKMYKKFLFLFLYIYNLFLLIAKQNYLFEIINFILKYEHHASSKLKKYTHHELRNQVPALMEFLRLLILESDW